MNEQLAGRMAIYLQQVKGVSQQGTFDMDLG